MIKMIFIFILTCLIVYGSIHAIWIADREMRLKILKLFWKIVWVSALATGILSLIVFIF